MRIRNSGLLIFLLIGSLGITGCDRSDLTASGNDQTKKTAKWTSQNKKEPNTDKQTPSKEPLTKPTLDEAFGLPIPAELNEIRTKQKDKIEVATTRSIDDVENFFRRSLVDYEIFRVDQRHIHATPLKDGMPVIRARKYGSRVFVTYKDSEIVEGKKEANKKAKKQQPKDDLKPHEIPPGRVPNGYY